jgi:glycosyltransferase involved in cell wall biosynthesis
MIVPFSPNPIRGRLLEVLVQLKQHTQVDILCLYDGSPIELSEAVNRLTVISNTSKAARAFRILFGLVRGYPIGSEFYNSMRLRRALARTDLSRYDILYVHRLPIHRLGLKHPAILYDIDDCWSKTSRIMGASVRGYKRLLYALDSILAPRQELAACNSASIVLVTAEREAVHLRKLGVTTPIEVYMHDRRCGTLLRALRQRERFVVSFHGKLSYIPNAMALGVLNDDIAARLDPARYELRILGKCPPAFRSKFKALKFTGYVESMPDAIRDADLSVFPLSISLGFSNKAMESLAAGVPFIATRETVEGLPPMPDLLERGVYVREIKDFAEEIRRFSQLSLSERQEIAERCQAYVRSLYSSTFQKTQWQQLLERLTGKREPEGEHAPLA